MRHHTWTDHVREEIIYLLPGINILSEEQETIRTESR